MFFKSDKTDGFQPKKVKTTGWKPCRSKPLLDLMLKVLPILDWTDFRLWTLDTMLDFIFTCDHIVRVISKLFDRLAMQMNWFLCNLDVVIEVYSSYLRFLFVQFIYLFVLYDNRFCHLILFYCLLLLLLFTHRFYSFRCNCSVSSIYFILLSVIITLFLMLPIFFSVYFLVCKCVQISEQ